MRLNCDPPAPRALPLNCSDRLERPGCAWRRCLAIAGLFMVLSATQAWAQIYVIEQPDGSRRFSNEPVAGAKIFIETRYTGPAVMSTRLGPAPFEREIADAAGQKGIDARLVEAVIAVESAFDPNAISKKGAQGLMQLMPDTADRFGVANVWDPRQNIGGGTAYLRELIDMFNGDLHHVLAAYNAGEGAVTRHGGVPPYPETVQYIDRVLAYYRTLGAR